MKVSKGWICLHRDIRSHWLWQDKPFSKGLAFVDLLLLANHSDGRLLVGNKLIFVKRGDLVTSTVKLSEYWGWSRTKVTAFLKTLENDEMITSKSDNKKTAIHIVNYEQYQDITSLFEQQKDSKETSEKQQKISLKATENQQTDNSQTSIKQQSDIKKAQTTMINNDNNENNENIPPLPPTGETLPKTEKSRKEENSDDGFEIFWKAYPRKEKKPYALKAWKKLKPDKDTLAAMLEAIERKKQSEQWRKDNGQYIPHPATWLNGRCWEDTEEPLPPPQPTYEFDPENPYKNWR